MISGLSSGFGTPFMNAPKLPEPGSCTNHNPVMSTSAFDCTRCCAVTPNPHAKMTPAARRLLLQKFVLTFLPPLNLNQKFKSQLTGHPVPGFGSVIRKLARVLSPDVHV